MQVAERGISGAEIVDGKGAAQLADMLDDGVRVLGVLHDRALRQLEMQARRCECRRFERFSHRFDKIALCELAAGDVHADAQVSTPGSGSPSRCLPARLIQYKF